MRKQQLPVVIVERRSSSRFRKTTKSSFSLDSTPTVEFVHTQTLYLQLLAEFFRKILFFCDSTKNKSAFDTRQKNFSHFLHAPIQEVTGVQAGTGNYKNTGKYRSISKLSYSDEGRTSGTNKTQIQ